MWEHLLQNDLETLKTAIASYMTSSFVVAWDFFPGLNRLERGLTSHHSVPGLAMSGATPPLPRMLTWCVYEHLYTLFV
jgi:hypothetical protein